MLATRKTVRAASALVLFAGLHAAARARAQDSSGPLGRPPLIDDTAPPEPEGDVLADPTRLTLDEQASLREIDDAGTAVHALLGTGIGLTVVGGGLFGLSSVIGEPSRGVAGLGGTWDFGWMWIGVGVASLGVLTLVASLIVEGVRAGARNGLGARVRARLQREARQARAARSVALLGGSF